MKIRQYLGKALLRLFGWKIEGALPVSVPKAIFVVAPHTTWQEVPIGLAVQMAMGLRAGFLIRKEFFFFPLGPLLRLFGSIPVDRKKKNRLVESISDLFRQKDSLYLAITPEGTREKVTRFRSGFYYIARAAGVPLILSKYNFEEKKVIFSPPYQVSGDKEKDFDYFYRYFHAVPGRFREKSFFYEKLKVEEDN